MYRLIIQKWKDSILGNILKGQDKTYYVQLMYKNLLSICMKCQERTFSIIHMDHILSLASSLWLETRLANRQVGGHSNTLALVACSASPPILYNAMMPQVGGQLGKTA